MAPRKRKKSDLDDFVVDDVFALNSQQDYQPETRPRKRKPQPAPGPCRLKPINQQAIRKLMGVMQKQTPSSSQRSSNADADEEADDSPDEAVSQRLAQGEDDIDLFSDVTLDLSVDLDAEPEPRSTRGAAADAGPQIRLHARAERSQVDLDDDSQDTGDEISYAPFETQLEADLCRPLTQSELDIVDCEDVGILPGPRTHDRGRYTELVKAVETDGLNPLIEYALASELQSGSKFGIYFAGEAPEYWNDLSRMTLCTMPSGVLHELTCGNLKKAYDNDPALKESLDRNAERGREHPSVYARVLTNQSGDPLNVSGARRLAQWLLNYISQATSILTPIHMKAFCNIDSQFDRDWRLAATEAGDRSFLSTRDSTRSASRVNVIETFCRQLLGECLRCEQENRQLPPLLYIGYAARTDIRKRQHEACGKSSNWLATLVQAICNAVWGSDSYKMNFFVICPLAEKRQGVVAEMLLTRILGAYYTAGGGFCIDIAGKSMESIHFRKLTVGENIDHWNELYAWVEKHTPLTENYKLERARSADVKRRQKAEEKAALEHEADDSREDILSTLKDLSEYYHTCQQYKDDPDWQTPEGKEYIRQSEELWEDAKKKYPELVASLPPL